jgi:hypothetical protein
MGDGPSIELDKITEILIDGIWHPVTPGSLLLTPFELGPGHVSVPGIGFQTGPRTMRRNIETIYAPMSSVSAVKTMDETRTKTTGE